MFRSLANTVFLVVLVVCGSVGLYVYHQHFSAEQKIHELQLKNEEQQQVIGRLKAERRVAKILVTSQKPGPDGMLQTTLLFVEYAGDGSALPAKRYVLAGNEIHFDAEVIKFAPQYIEQADALRGQSIILFTRLYSSRQSPESGFVIDEPGKIPDIYRADDPQVSDFENNLWSNFWKLYSEKSYRELMGVHGADGEGLWGRFDMDHLYVITVQAQGGGTLSAEPMEPIYRQALQQPRPAPDTQ